MTAALAIPGNTADTFLVHFFGTGLTDDRYVVERYRALADGDIIPAPAEAPKAKGRGKAKNMVVSRKQAEAMRPGRTEIIICTGLSTRGGRQACLPGTQDFFVNHQIQHCLSSALRHSVVFNLSLEARQSALAVGSK